MDVTNREELLVRQMRYANANYRMLKEHDVRAINVMGPVGCGKTTLIEQLIERLISCGLSVGAVATVAEGDTDYQRFLTCGARSANVQTGEEGYLDATGLNSALSSFDLDAIDVLFIENVPGIISPVDYPLGTGAEIVVLPLTAGNGIVQSYPRIFTQTDLLVINKIDLASTVNIAPETISAEYVQINPQGKVVFTDAHRGSGIADLLRALGFDCNVTW